MLPRHVMMSATMLALAASPEPDDEPHRRDINAFTEHVLHGEPLRTGYVEIDAALTSAVGGSLNVVSGPAHCSKLDYLERKTTQEIAAKKARAKRKAKKGWA